MEERHILVTGGSGLVGKHLRSLIEGGLAVEGEYWHFMSSDECDLTKEKPKTFGIDTVVHLAAKVNGLFENQRDPIGHYIVNSQINRNVVDWALENEIKNFIGVLSSCIYPERDPNDDYSFPMYEKDIFEGEPPTSNYGYALAKRNLGREIKFIGETKGWNWMSIAPSNIFGRYDDFNPETGHFVGSFLGRVKRALDKGESVIHLSGTGTPMRQFVYAEDVANLIISLVRNEMKIGTGIGLPDYTASGVRFAQSLTNRCLNFYNTIDPKRRDDSIYDLSHRILKALDLQDKIKIYFDNDRTKDGQYRKTISSSLFGRHLILPFEMTPFDEAIKEVWNEISAG